MIDANRIRGHLDGLILAVLKDDPAHGFEILKRIEARGHGELSMKEGSLYPALYRLEARRLIKGEWENGQVVRRGPRRRIYNLTNEGHKQLSAERESWRVFVSTLNSVMEVG